MPARHKHSRLAVRREKKSKPKLGRLALFLSLLVVLVLVFFYFFLSASGGLARISFVSTTSSGDVIYSLFDFKGGTISTINIPGATQVDVARSLGSWKVSVVTRLGENEKIGGDVLLAETITKSLRLPVTTARLSLLERLRIEILKFNLRSSHLTNIDLAKTNYLVKTKLSDGTLGYKVRDSDLPFELKAILADADVSRESATILLENLSGKGYVEGEVGGIIEVLGGKVASVTKGEVKGLDCTVYGDAKLTTYQVMAKVFACSRGGRLTSYNFDVVLRIGTGFTARY